MYRSADAVETGIVINILCNSMVWPFHEERWEESMLIVVMTLQIKAKRPCKIKTKTKMARQYR